MRGRGGATRWALIVGASRGFGEVTSKALAREGLDILGVHFDGRANMDHVNEVVEAIKADGHEVIFFNINAADAAERADALSQMQTYCKQGHGDRF